MAEAVISTVVQTLGSLLVEEGKFLHGVEDQTRRLHGELKHMQRFLKDVDQRQHEGKQVADWVSEVRDLAYKAENLIEHYVFNIQSRRGGGVRRRVKRCICLLDEYSTLHQLGRDIEQVSAEISQLTSSFQTYGIASKVNEAGSSSSSQHELRRTYSHVVEKDLVGIEGQVQILARELIGDGYKSVSIYGMGGLGKTTMARKVYHHPYVRHKFEAFAWICVSQQWQTRELLQDLITKFMPEKRGTIKDWSDRDLVREIYEFQKNHKCLVVIDDIWSENAWECIKPAFSIREGDSKVLLTTRNKEVAEHIDPIGFLYQPRLLKQKDSWKLLRRRFQDCDEMTEEMEELGKEMIKYCGGLPLAVHVLGGILANKKTLMDWKNVHENIKSYMGKENKIGQDHKGLNSILVLSYNDLPYQLKSCLFYLSMYKEDARIETESLYQIWMAEGMICTDDRIGEEPIMDVAERYLEELSKRCMVVVEMNKWISNNRFESCRIHDLMRDMCLEKAKDENFLKLIDRPHVNETIDQNDQRVDSSNIFFNTGRFYRRLAIHVPLEDVESYVPPRKELTQQLRSFVFDIVESGGTMKPVFASYKMLRVLSITNVRGQKWISFSQAIGNLIHLRYLSLRDSKLFRSLPSCISELRHLETLDLRVTYIIRISKAIRKLGRLKHLYLASDYEVGFKFGLDGLHNLEILENFDSRCCEVKALSTLTNLRSLKAYVWSELEDLEEFIKQVIYLRCLRCLSLDIDLDFFDFDSEKGFTLFREMFYRSPLNVLDIRKWRLSKLPEYEPYFLPDVHTLALSQTAIQEDPMSTLEKLPNLRRLILISNAFVGNEMICHANGFLKLKSFVIAYLETLNNIRIEKGAMPNLSQLRITDCPNLKMVPDGLRFISTLTELEIWSMPDEFNARLQIKDGRQGEDFDKVRHVPSITFSK